MSNSEMKTYSKEESDIRNLKKKALPFSQCADDRAKGCVNHKKVEF